VSVGAAIRVRHLWHNFGGPPILRDVSFDVERGEIFGFIGPNGAGKTTTIRIMSTLLEPVAGRVEIEGMDVTMAPEKVRRIIGYMADHAGIYERISVREYLEFFADAYRIPALSVVGAVLELTDTTSLQDELVATLSKGQKQRLQVARILLHDPKVLILDEPASDLDPRARIEIRDLLMDLQSLGKTIILSSHILSELADVCTSIGIIERGQLVVAGPIDSIAHTLAQQQAASGQPITNAADSLGVARVVKLRLLGDPSRAAAQLQGGPGIADVRTTAYGIEVAYTGDDAAIANIVSHLVHRDFGILAVEQEHSDLERLFLHATRGEGQR
jgi:ABC-2 type transport system ATP-binding protein